MNPDLLTFCLMILIASCGLFLLFYKGDES